MGCNINMTIMSLVILVQVTAAYGEFDAVHYESELTSAQQCLQDAKIQIALEQNRISELKKQISSIEEQKLRIYSEFGISENEVKATEHELADLHHELENFIEAKDSSEKLDSVLNLSSLKASVIKKSKVSKLKRISKKIEIVDSLLNFLSTMCRSTQEKETAISENDSIKGVIDTTITFYTVKSSPAAHETLYGIAKFIYGNPQRWTEIYIANKALIDSNYQRFGKRIKTQNKRIDPSDFILPGQILTIPAKTVY